MTTGRDRESQSAFPPIWVPCADQAINSESYEHGRGGPAQRLLRNARVDRGDERNDKSHRKRMTDSDGRKGIPHSRPALFLQSESHSEKPAHAGIDAMECAEPAQRQPGPDFAHG
jgi:hypothetical protein